MRHVVGRAEPSLKSVRVARVKESIAPNATQTLEKQQTGDQCRGARGRREAPGKCEGTQGKSDIKTD